MNSVVDTKMRRKYALLLRQFASGRVDNFAFMKQEEELNSDDAIIKALPAVTWYLYDDFRSHKLIGKWKLDKVGCRMVSRLVLFLMSDYPYQAPPVLDFQDGAMRKWLNFITFGLVRRSAHDEALIGRDEWFEDHIWPFATQADLEEARRYPKLLCHSK